MGELKCSECGTPFTNSVIGNGDHAIKLSLPACECRDKRMQAEIKKEQEQKRRDKYISLLTNSNIPERCRDKAYGIPLHDEYEENGDDVSKHLEYEKIHLFLKDPEFYLSNYSGVFMCGNAGTRKTTYACEMAKRVMMLGRSARYFQCAEIVTKKIYVFDNIRTDFLILDDLGNDNIERRDNLLWTLVNKRIDAKKFTIIITNFSDSHNREMHGEPFMDRLKLFFPIAMIGESSRKSL